MLVKMRVTETGKSYLPFLWVVDVLWLVESLEALHSDGEAQGYEEDRVHQGA